MNALAADPAMADTSTMTSHAYTYQHQLHPNLCSSLLNFEWAQDIDLHTDDDDVAMCLGGEQIDSRRCDPTAFRHLDESETERHFVEWVQQSDDDDDMQEPATQSYSVSSAASSVLWYHSRLASTPSASTSVDSLGLHHVTSFPAAAAGDPSTSKTYDKANFNTIGIQHELPELDITQISPSSGDPLINWRSPPGVSYCSLHGDEFGSLLGQKRPREDDPELVNGCKRRRMPAVWVAG